MKKLAVGLALVVCASAVFAGAAPESSSAIESQLIQVNNNLMQLQASVLKTQQPRDAKSFCYHEDKAYSEGDKLNDMTCRRKGSADVFAKDTNKYPLFWEANKQ